MTRSTNSRPVPKARQREIEKLLEEHDALDTLDEGLVDEEELIALGLDEGPDHQPIRDIDGIRQRRILRAIDDYGQEEALELELVTTEELIAMGYEVAEFPPDLDDDDAMEGYWERNG